MQILFLGAPGAGKGTQCKRVAKQLNIPHLSSGDLLREAVKAGTEAGVKAKSFMDQGVLVPDHVLIAMFRDKLSSPECAKGFLLDGFPRNLAQAEALDAMLKDIKKDLLCVVDLKVDPGLLTERITGRRVCTNKACLTPFHIKFQPPAKEGHCDTCGSTLMIRDDDKEELVAARLKTYNEQTAPLIEYYGKRSILKTINGDGEPEAIFTELLAALQSKCHA
ncbi:MAG: adenylate kinase [Candidatus Obscuribacterales bacterium]|nr:adenylate kinase [Candidatus Obscuribacterales bacterium]